MPVPSEVESEKQQGGESPPSPECPMEQPPAQQQPEEENIACKLFVGGLLFDYTEEELKEKFQKFGDVKRVKIMIEPNSNRRRGFSFVTFDKEDSVTKVLNAHKTDPMTFKGRDIEPKKATPHKRSYPSTTSNFSTARHQHKRVFIGGIGSDSKQEDLSSYFEQFGEVCDCQLMIDRNTDRHRGFGFVSFTSEGPAQKVCSIQYHDIKGKKVEVKVAQSKEALAQANGGSKSRPPGSARGNYGYAYNGYGPAPGNYYGGSPPYGPSDYMSMGGGYPTGPFMVGNGMRKHHLPRGKDYQYPPYMFQNWGDSRMPYYSHGFPMPIMVRGPGAMDPGMIVPTSGMDFMTDQFQGMSMGGYPPSPMGGAYPPMSHVTANTDGGSAGGSPQDLSPPPTSVAPSFNTQVPGFTGTASSFSNGTAVVGGANYN